jgi:hypothetical protein
MKGIGRGRTIVLGIVLALALFWSLVFVSIVFDWVEIGVEDPPPDSLYMPSSEGAATATDEEGEASWPFEQFPINEYSSFEEAEEAAGYHIPRPSSEYSLKFDLTFLRWFPQLDRPASETHYTYPPQPSISIVVMVSPSYFSNDPSKLTSGPAMTVGGKSGWLFPDDDQFVLNYTCGEVDGYDVWCGVSAPKEIGWEEFEHFVYTLQ